MPKNKTYQIMVEYDTSTTSFVIPLPDDFVNDNALDEGMTFDCERMEDGSIVLIPLDP